LSNRSDAYSDLQYYVPCQLSEPARDECADDADLTGRRIQSGSI
jgi:hypothetical protein